MSGKTESYQDFPSKNTFKICKETVKLVCEMLRWNVHEDRIRNVDTDLMQLIDEVEKELIEEVATADDNHTKRIRND